MKKYLKNLLFGSVFFFSITITAQNPDFHIYLCFGQSNMEGQGKIETFDKQVDARFQVLQSTDCDNLEREIGKWYTAVPPLSQCYTGLSPSDEFGKTLVKSLPKNIKVGVINVAIGGCDIRLFDKDLYLNHTETYKEEWFINKIAAYGGNPYERLINLSKKAQKKGVIKGILLHQGETNTGDEQWPLYVKKIYENILKDLSLDPLDVPLLVGEVVHEEQQGKCASMNKIINKVPEIISNSFIISSKGCKIKPDLIHFNAEGYRELGKRYALTMLEYLSEHE